MLAAATFVATDADGTVLRSAAKVQPGDPVRVQLQDGALHCRKQRGGCPWQGKLTFEASMQRLDEIVKQLEKGDVPLDASLALFEEGSRLLAACNEMLDGGTEGRAAQKGRRRACRAPFETEE